MSPSAAVPPATELMTVILDDFRCVSVRLIRDDDAARLQRLHASLSARTNRLRFFAVIPTLSARDAEHFACVDHYDREAVVGEVKGEIVAVVRYDRLLVDGAAEIALLVRDDYQHHRLGPILLAELLALAKERGVTRVIAETLPENNDVLHAINALGLPCQTRESDGLRTITVELS